MLAAEVVEQQQGDGEGGQAEAQAAADGEDQHGRIVVSDAEGAGAYGQGAQGQDQEQARLDELAHEPPQGPARHLGQGLQAEHGHGHVAVDMPLGQVLDRQADHRHAHEQMPEIGGQQHIELRCLQRLLHRPVDDGAVDTEGMGRSGLVGQRAVGAFRGPGQPAAVTDQRRADQAQRQGDDQLDLPEDAPVVMEAVQHPLRHPRPRHPAEGEGGEIDAERTRAPAEDCGQDVGGRDQGHHLETHAAKGGAQEIKREPLHCGQGRKAAGHDQGPRHQGRAHPQAADQERRDERGKAAGRAQDGEAQPRLAPGPVQLVDHPRQHYAERGEGRRIDQKPHQAEHAEQDLRPPVRSGQGRRLHAVRYADWGQIRTCV